MMQVGKPNKVSVKLLDAEILKLKTKIAWLEAEKEKILEALQSQDRDSQEQSAKATLDKTSGDKIREYINTWGQ